MEVIIQVDFLGLAFLFRFNALAKATAVCMEAMNSQRNYSSKALANCSNRKRTCHWTSRKHS